MNERMQTEESLLPVPSTGTLYPLPTLYPRFVFVVLVLGLVVGVIERSGAGNVTA